MYGSWQQYINDFKSMVSMSAGTNSNLRLALYQQEIESFWDDQNMIQMEQILTINCSYAINFMLTQLLPPYITTRRTVTEAYTVGTIDENSQEQIALYVYDCKLFRGNIYSKEENQFISSLNLVYREDVLFQENTFDVADINNLAIKSWQIKVKESCLLRVYGYLKDVFRRVRQRQDKIVLEQAFYDKFIEEWMKCYFNYNIEITVGFFFRGLVALLENQILRYYLNTLVPEQIKQRQFGRPIKVIDKPRNVEQFTFTEGITKTETKWQSLKITAFRLKYRVNETQDKYECYMAQEQDEKDWDFQIMSQEDQIIWGLFDKMRKNQQEYDSAYC